MADATGNRDTAIAAMVTAGEGETEAVRLTPYILMGRDNTNAYLITSADGDVLINAGMMDGGARMQANFAKLSQNPLRYAIVTQAHPDHHGGLEHFMQPGTRLVTGAGQPEVRGYWDRLGPFYGSRAMKLWAPVSGTATPNPPTKRFEPDILVNDRFTFEVGGRPFEVIAMPVGETLDSVVVWLPQERVLFISNLFGPAWLNIPNFNTIRGDKPRLVEDIIKSAEQVRALGAETLVTGHGEPIYGADRIKKDLTRLIDALSYLQDETIKGMNEGKMVETLMREIVLPPELALTQLYGATSWTIKSIWMEYVGWFDDRTTSLYSVPQAAIHPDLVELAGGSDVIAARAREYLEAGQPLEALHLVEVALTAEPGNPAAKAVKLAASKRLLAEQTNQNFQEIMWLRAEIASLENGA